MSCADIESLLCEYAEGILAPAAKAEVDLHLAECPACAALARDSMAALRFLDHVAEVEPPPELLTRILFDPPWVRHQHLAGARHWLRNVLHPLLQPRFAMGMAMTILSFAMLARFVVPVRQLRPSDLDPGKIWTALDNSLYRGWQRTVKFYDSLRFVYQVQSQLREWQQEQEDSEIQSEPESAKPLKPADEHRLPLGRRATAPDDEQPESKPAEKTP